MMRKTKARFPLSFSFSSVVFHFCSFPIALCCRFFFFLTITILFPPFLFSNYEKKVKEKPEKTQGEKKTHNQNAKKKNNPREKVLLFSFLTLVLPFFFSLSLPTFSLSFFLLVIVDIHLDVVHHLRLLLHQRNLFLSQHHRLTRQHGLRNQLQLTVVRELLREPHKRLLEVVVALRADIVVLKPLLAVERDHLRLDLALRTVDLISHQHNRNFVADTGNIAVPVRHALVRVSGRDVEHDNGAVAFNVVSITQTAEFFLARGIPAVEADLAAVGEEGEGVDVDADGGDVALFELAGEMALDEGGLARTAVSDEDQLEGRNAVCRRRLSHFLLNRVVFVL